MKHKTIITILRSGGETTERTEAHDKAVNKYLEADVPNHTLKSLNTFGMIGDKDDYPKLVTVITHL